MKLKVVVINEEHLATSNKLMFHNLGTTLQGVKKTNTKMSY